MSKFYFSRFFLVVFIILMLALTACGGGATEEVPTLAATQPPAVPTDTAVPPSPVPTEVPPTEETAVIQPATALSSDLNTATDRATTLATANAKPTVAPFAGLVNKEDDSSAAPAIVPTNTPQPTPVPQAGTTGFLIENNASATVCYLYITPSTSDSWGDDLLGTSGLLEAGANMTVELAPDVYDIRLDDCFGKAIARGSGIELSVGILPLTVSDADVPTPGNAPITMLNDLDALACYVYIGPSSSDSWGNDWLGTGIVVLPGNSMTFNIPPGTTDFKATDCNFETLSELYSVEVTAEGGIWTLSGNTSEATSLELINQGTATVCYVQISLTTATEWGDDWLGENDTIPSGSSFTFQMPADTYDLRALDCSQNVISEQYEIAIEGATTLSIP